MQIPQVEKYQSLDPGPVSEAKAEADKEKRARQELEKELGLEEVMKAEMEMAMKLLEKDVHEKQDTIVTLRSGYRHRYHQLISNTRCSRSSYSKSGVSESPNDSLLETVGARKLFLYCQYWFTSYDNVSAGLAEGWRYIVMGRVHYITRGRPPQVINSEAINNLPVMTLTLRAQLEDIKTINLEMFTKLAECQKSLTYK